MPKVHSQPSPRRKQSSETCTDAVSAATVLEKAIKLNSLLRNQYQPLLKEAKAISAQS